MALRHYTDEVGRQGIERLGLITPSADGFLVVYDYGQGGVSAFVEAPSKEEILRRFPELEVVETRPPWMSEAYLDQIRATTLDLDRPSGLLSDLVAQRKASSAGNG